NFLFAHICQKSQTPEIDAQSGHQRIVNITERIQHGAITTEAQHHIGIAITKIDMIGKSGEIAFEHNMLLQALFKIFKYYYFNLLLIQNLKQHLKKCYILFFKNLVI